MVNAQSAVVSRAINRRAALREGLFVDSEAPTQKPRIDDLRVRLDDLEIEKAEIEANSAALDQSINAEEHRRDMLEQSVIKSPVHGQIWRRIANEGQYIVGGGDVVDLVDTASIRAEGYFHQQYLPDVGIGNAAVLLPVGAHCRINGTIGWVGAEITGQSKTVAPQWAPRQNKAMRVIVELNPADRGRVWLGQRVKVVVSPVRPRWLGNVGSFLLRLGGV